MRTKTKSAQEEVAKACDAVARLCERARSTEAELNQLKGMEAELNRLKETRAVANLSVIIRRIAD